MSSADTPCQACSTNSVTLWRKNADMPSIDFTGQELFLSISAYQEQQLCRATVHSDLHYRRKVDSYLMTIIKMDTVLLHRTLFSDSIFRYSHISQIQQTLKNNFHTKRRTSAHQPKCTYPRSLPMEV